ncbi:hypothetical protein [Flavobacterium litorale]|uniref:DUF4305 domain-containing protein n=1 Tax=Flavobacterium litorale TaxID=2856519 RepID=A0ABX8V2T7_9FLAO|nr:hypothetical protein [Flavobacterium litorale]QYJ67159.1 hypothetical protein K1I41_06170 [Flavobacterium litorale]
MKEKAGHFVGGLVLYGLGGYLIILATDKDIANKWQFIVFWAVSMALVDVFLITPLRKKLAAKKAAKQQQ